MKRKQKRKLRRSQRRHRNRHNRHTPVEAYFPLHCNECGYTATCPGEMNDHEHDVEQFAP